LLHRIPAEDDDDGRLLVGSTSEDIDDEDADPLFKPSDNDDDDDEEEEDEDDEEEEEFQKEKEKSVKTFCFKEYNFTL
jgi:hypothetical protein